MLNLRFGKDVSMARAEARVFTCEGGMSTTIVLVDSMEYLEKAIETAVSARPDHLLEYSVRGLGVCQDIIRDNGQPIHLHWFGDDAEIMRGNSMDELLNNGGSYIYVTPNADADHVTRFCNGMASINPAARPEILQV